MKVAVPSECWADKRMYASACRSCNASKGDRLPDSEHHLQQVSDVLGYDIRGEIWAQNLWQPKSAANAKVPV